SERLYIKGGKIVNADLTTRADIFIENGVIRQLGIDLTIPGGVTTIDAHGALIIPGGIDLAVEFGNSPVLDEVIAADVTSVDDCYSASRAALLGGTTTIVSFSTGEKGKLASSFLKKSESCESSCCDVSLHVDVTSWDDDVKEAMTKLSSKHGVNTFRVFMSGKWQLSDGELYDVFKHIRDLGCIALVHAENGSIIRKQTEKFISEGHVLPEYLLTSRNEQKVHLTQLKISRLILALDQSSGKPVYGQALAISLIQDGSIFSSSSWNKAASCVTWPPLRDSLTNINFCINVLPSGALQFVSSGHCVYTDHDKSKLGKKNFSKIPPGTNGVFERMMAVWSAGVEKGIIDENEFVSLTSSNAARLLNLYPQKGHIAIGSDADLVIWRVNEARSLADASSELTVAKLDCTNSFEGVESKGYPAVVVAHGKVVYDEGKINVIQSMGNQLDRPTNTPMVYNKLAAKDEL
uniref:dihydropyrimidinase n=1 Tax=Ciona savignyi TaxID=51511 RepID=H2YZ10_CIOSA